MQKLISGKKKKVLFITSTFPLNRKDTQVPWMSQLVRRLRAKGEEIDVFAPSFKGAKSSRYFNINVYRFRYAPSFFEVLTYGEGALFKLRKKPLLFIISFFYIFFGALSAIHVSFQKKYDIIHVNWPFPQGIFGIAAKIVNPNAKMVLTFYGAEFSLIRQVPFGVTILRLILKRADSVIAISNSTKNKIQLIENVPVEIIPFASPIFIDKLNKLGKNNEPKKILFVGRLIERKGVQFLIDAMPYILSKIDARLDIVGGGPMLTKFKENVSNAHLQKNIFLHGRVNEKKLKEFYRSCDLFVLPAITDPWGDTEGLGVVLLEAMSFGKPVVASKVGGITDIVIDRVNGLLVPEKNSIILANAIVEILTNNILRKEITVNSRKTVEKFSWNKIVDDTKRIYEMN